MKSTSPMGKELLGKVKDLKLGESVKFPPILPGLNQVDSVAVLRERSWDETLQKGYWEFGLYWMGVYVSDVNLEVVDGELFAEVLA
jgi:hypothetical protein